LRGSSTGDGESASDESNCGFLINDTHAIATRLKDPCSRRILIRHVDDCAPRH
jgi:hypothetical protein